MYILKIYQNICRDHIRQSKDFTEWYKTLLKYVPLWEKACRTIYISFMHLLVYCLAPMYSMNVS